MKQKNISVLVLFFQCVLFLNCSSKKDLERFINSKQVDGVTILQNGYVTTIKIEKGNLLDSAIFSREERALLLTDFVTNNGRYFKIKPKMVYYNYPRLLGQIKSKNKIHN